MATKKEYAREAAKFNESFVKTWRPGRAAGTFMNSYSAHLNRPDYINESDMKAISRGILKKPYEQVLDIYEIIENRLKSEIKADHFEQASILKKTLEYYTENILDKKKMPKRVYRT